MKRITIILSLILLPKLGFTQKIPENTDSFTVTGLVDKPKTITFQDLEKEKIVELGDFKITNHLGEFRKEYKNVKGVSLLNLIKNITIAASNPKFLSEYYLIFKASDGYSVVVSWNELFNTEIGNSFFIVVEADGKSQANATEKILLISIKDFSAGKRHVKGLQSIEIKKI